MSSNEFNKLDRDYTEREDYLASRAEERGAPIRAHDKTAFMVERLRYISETDDAHYGGIRETLFDAISLLEQLVTQGANVLPPSGGAGANKGDGMEIKLTPAVIACLKRGLNCWAKQNDAEGIEIKEILKKAEEVKLRIAEDV